MGNNRGGGGAAVSASAVARRFIEQRIVRPRKKPGGEAILLGDRENVAEDMEHPDT